MESGIEKNVEMMINEGRKNRWIEFKIDWERDEKGNVIGIVKKEIEIKEMKRREKVLKKMMSEVRNR